jgi:hypothetical protein
MNKGHKKSAVKWVQRLFGRPFDSLTTTQTKTYFVHRYLHDHTASEQTPFNALFSDFGDKKPKRGETYAGDQRLYRPEPDSPAIANYAKSKAGLNFDSNIPITPEDGYRPSNGNRICAQFKVLNAYDETHDTKTFRLSNLDNQSFDYLPGQYITLSIDISGQTYKRSYNPPWHLGNHRKKGPKRRRGFQLDQQSSKERRHHQGKWTLR